MEIIVFIPSEIWATEEIPPEVKHSENLAFIFKQYDAQSFGRSVLELIEASPEIFVRKSKSFLSEKKLVDSNAIDRVVFVAPPEFNLRGNYLWYSSGTPESFSLLLSSFLYENFPEFQNIKFWVYAILFVLQFLSRHTINIEGSHKVSKGCLNDFCRTQTDALKVFEKDIPYCEYCQKNILDNKIYSAILKTFKYIQGVAKRR